MPGQAIAEERYAVNFPSAGYYVPTDETPNPEEARIP